MSSESEATVGNSQFWLLASELRVFEPPFTHERGLMWSKSLPETADALDIAGNNRSRSFVFEDGYQLPEPHAPHDDIAKVGAGRFSHWESTPFLSPSDGSGPNTDGRLYRLLTPRP